MYHRDKEHFPTHKLSEIKYNQKVNSIIKKILRKFGRTILNNSERHQDNILRGQQIEIDGKRYVKVKLKFVDTMDFNLAKHVDNLETENVLLQKELNQLHTENELCNTKMYELQNCNINTFRDNQKLKETFQDKKLLIKNLTLQIKENNKNIARQGKKIKEQEALLKKYKRLHLQHNDDKTVQKQRAEITRLTKELEYRIENNEILVKRAKRVAKVESQKAREQESKQELIETLTEKLFAQKTEIEYLWTRLKSSL